MMQEDCVVDGGRVRLQAGHQARAPTAAMPARMSPQARSRSPPGGGCAAPISASPPRSAMHELPVFRPLRVALLSTGDEVREPGHDAAARRDLRRQPLHARRRCCDGLGCVVSDFGIRPDREAALADTLAAASAEHDLIVTSGGVSTGEEDHVKAAIERLGRAAFLAAGDQAGPAGRARPGRRRAADRPARQPGRGGRDLRRPRPAADPEARRRRRPRRRGCFRCAPASPTARSRGGANMCAPAWSATATRWSRVKYPSDGAGILSSIVRSDGSRHPRRGGRRSRRRQRWSISCPSAEVIG